MAKQALQKTPASRTSLCFKEEDFDNSLQMKRCQSTVRGAQDRKDCC